MALNDDGLEPGQQVDFATVLRVNRERGKRNAKADEAPKRSRPAKARKPTDSAAAVPKAQEVKH